jgi:aminoglycoside phosphotransferase family enzyme/predicted kinase
MPAAPEAIQARAQAAGGAEPELAEGLARAAAYRHRPPQVEHLETHISHVFLTGPYAYKIKKRLDLGFLDFSTLEKRRQACLEEVRINRRLAPELYLDVVPISGTAARPEVEGAGPPIEYAVKMRQFSNEGMLERVLARGELTSGLIDAIAEQLAGFHAGLPPAGPDGPYGQPAAIMGPALQNFDQLAPLLTQRLEHALLGRLREWTEQQHAALGPLFAQRLAEGFVRECHGDLHLGNLVLVDGRVRIFDAIEFNPHLRWIDVINEAAFLTMDLLQRGQAGLAWRFINAYLERTGDYEGVPLLRYYLVYRALVRAKVAAIRASQRDTSPPQREALLRKCDAHLALADRIVRAARGALVIHHGVAGSGKTWASQIVLETIGAIRVRSDVERKRMVGLAAGARTGAGIEGGIYTSESTAAVYERLVQLARAVAEGGFTALVDATFLKRAQRSLFRDLARGVGVPFAIADFQADEAVLRARVAARARQAQDASEADLDVLEHQLRSREPLREDEAQSAVTFRTDQMTVEDVRAQADVLDTRLANHKEEQR